MIYHQSYVTLLLPSRVGQLSKTVHRRLGAATHTYGVSNNHLILGRPYRSTFLIALTYATQKITSYILSIQRLNYFAYLRNDTYILDVVRTIIAEQTASSANVPHTSRQFLAFAAPFSASSTNHGSDTNTSKNTESRSSPTCPCMPADDCHLKPEFIITLQYSATRITATAC